MFAIAFVCSKRKSQVKDETEIYKPIYGFGWIWMDLVGYVSEVSLVSTVLLWNPSVNRCSIIGVVKPTSRKVHPEVCKWI